MLNKEKICSFFHKLRFNHKDPLLRHFKDESNQYDLAPVYIEREDKDGRPNPKYGPVEDIANKLGDENVRNIALTGPYGSGKSSVLRTLMRDYPKAKYLSISLATLEDDTLYKDLIDKDKEVQQNKGTDKSDKKIPKEKDEINHLIEYSILQQIIYKEKASKLRQSRLKRIQDIRLPKALMIAGAIVLAVIAVIVLFEPEFLMVESLRSIFSCSTGWKKVWDLLCVVYLTGVSIFFIGKIFVATYNSKVNKLNFKDGEISIAENTSVFNKHLDEIIYFFEVTKYNVVIIEDLDRFETTHIFLKLRELNQLLNSSNSVGRRIVFIYAVRDDIFNDTNRTKFFDFITSIIPVINPSNSKAKLKAALKERGFDENEILDNDLSEMAFFIQDMRMLTNIANEYSQYRQKLYDPNKKNLDLTKLLAMIVYKNCHPKDFANLHKREGVVYQCLNTKQQFITEALKVLDEKKKELEEAKKMQEANNHLKENDLRLLFLYELASELTPNFTSIRLNNSTYTLKQIADNSNLFSQLQNQDKITYYYNGPYNRGLSESKTIDLSNIANRMHFEERMMLINDSSKVIGKKEEELQEERLKIQSLRINQLIRKFNLGETELYKKLELKPLMDVFIRLGYIDEDYYDYISYFYPGMVSTADRDLLISMKQQIKQEYTYHIDKTDNFIKELKDYMFEHDAILNNELLDYLARKTNSKGIDMFVQVMRRLEKEDAPLDFLSQYYQFGKQQKEVFSHFIGWNEDLSWQMIENHTNDDEKQLLREAWLRFCEKTTVQIQWLNRNYPFLSARADNIGMSQCKNLIKGCQFIELDDNNEALLTEVINQCCYAINTENLCIIANHLNKRRDVIPNNLNLTRITETHQPVFENFIKDSFSTAFPCFSTSCKDESEENILYLLNSEDISSEQKISYLNGQQNTISDFTGVDEKYWMTAIQSKIVAPTWKNVDTYFNKYNTITEALLEYIKHYHSKLEVPCTDDVESKETLFEELLGTNNLDIDAYRSVCKAFDNVFDGYDELGQLKAERLDILLNNNKIAFSEENTQILQNSSFYPEYLIHYHKEFIGNLDKSYNIDVNCASRLLDSEKFSLQEKRKIIDILPSNVFVGSPTLSDKAIQVLLSSKDISIGQDKLNNLLKTAKNEEYKVYLVVQMLSNYSYNNENIPSLLSLLGGTYDDIAERKKRPVIESNGWNRALLSKLVEIGFISSTTDEKDGIRVNPKRN